MNAYPFVARFVKRNLICGFGLMRARLSWRIKKFLRGVWLGYHERKSGCSRWQMLSNGRVVPYTCLKAKRFREKRDEQTRVI